MIAAHQGLLARQLCTCSSLEIVKDVDNLTVWRHFWAPVEFGDGRQDPALVHVVAASVLSNAWSPTCASRFRGFRGAFRKSAFNRSS